MNEDRPSGSTTHDFDKHYWDQHWKQAAGGEPGAVDGNPPNPYLIRGTSALTPGTALDAGCGAGAEAIWLASHGWQVTATDIAADALARASRSASMSGVSQHVRWIEADLTVWSPDTQFDLVTTHYAHPATSQLAFYGRISGWVAPGGTLLIVGHMYHDNSPGGEQHPPAEASVTPAQITETLNDTAWQIVTAEEQRRTIGGRAVPLHDVVVQATRRS